MIYTMNKKKKRKLKRLIHKYEPYAAVAVGLAIPLVAIAIVR